MSDSGGARAVAHRINRLLGNQVLAESEAVPPADREFAVRLFRGCPEIRFLGGRFSPGEDGDTKVNWTLVSASLIIQVCAGLNEDEKPSLERFIQAVEPINARSHTRRLRTILSARLVELLTIARSRLLFGDPTTHDALEVPQ